MRFQRSFISSIAIISGLFAAVVASIDEHAAQPADAVFFDDFDHPVIDSTKWWYGLRVWGSNNHGVIPENVMVTDGICRIAANGDTYSGSLKGVSKSNGSYVQNQPGTRCGGVLVTDRYFGSGKYEVRLKLPSRLGVCSAMWTFFYRELYENDPDYDRYISQGYHQQGTADDGYYLVVNHEIDIEIPTALRGQSDALTSYQNSRYNTWIGEVGGEFTDNFFDNGYNYNDGQFHIWRFDWHTGGDGQTPRVDFYVDSVLKYTCTTHIPFIKGRFTVGTWFPTWAGPAGGKADFDVEYLDVDWVRITPFNEPNDQTVAETYPDDGLTHKNNLVVAVTPSSGPKRSDRSKAMLNVVNSGNSVAVSTEGNVPFSNFSIFDYSGKCMRKGVCDSKSITIEKRNMASGVYLLKLDFSGEKAPTVHRILF